MSNKVLLVDEHPIIRLALANWLEANGLKVVAETGKGIEAMQLMYKHEPDLLVLEIDIPDLNGFVIIERIKLLELPIKIVVFSAQDSRLSIIDCAQVGACGFVSKTQDPDVLLKAIRTVQAGQKFFPAWMQSMQHVAVSNDPMERLSWRERQVVQLLKQGFSNRQIADRMQLSSKTISTFKTRSLKKLNANSLVELVNRIK
ncbi:response regulator transcription factor [Pseudomonas sp. ITA]|uniref:response regulator transcription factor n=1 Tax=Pseudomonas sp. ITA TaxID=2825841 RepID=UPI0024999548|nr:response regulator transcription factor [Pseudomonas sp. ITA]MDI2145896.1 response regulator transcription factor [Pseudomonas sp. ITA]